MTGANRLDEADQSGTPGIVRVDRPVRAIDPARSRTMHEVRLAMGYYAVPCGGCTLCCHGDAVRILPHEDASRWATEPHDYVPGALMLAHKPNGDCVYLGDGGCTRQTDKPQQCHEMDCRRIAQAVTKSQAKRLDAQWGMKIEIWRRGKELLRSNVGAKRAAEGGPLERPVRPL